MRCGNTVYVSGQIPLDPATGTLVSGDIDAEIRRVFENLAAIAAAAGGSLANVVKLSVFLTDLAHFPRVNEIMATYFQQPYPARAAVGVAAAAQGRARRDGVRTGPVLSRGATQPVTAAPLTALHGVGPALAERLQRFGVQSVPDLLFVLPLRYEDRTRAAAHRRACCPARARWSRARCCWPS